MGDYRIYNLCFDLHTTSLATNIRVRSQTGEGLNSTGFWIINCIGVAPFIAIYGLIKTVIKKWRKEKGSK